MYEQLILSCRSYYDIAKEVGASTATVIQAAKKLGLGSMYAQAEHPKSFKDGLGYMRKGIKRCKCRRESDINYFTKNASCYMVKARKLAKGEIVDPSCGDDDDD